MKRKILGTLLICSLLTISIACCKKIHTTPVQLPQTAQQFIKTHFPDLTISSITLDDNSFDVIFSNNYKMEFDKNGNWEEIDCQQNEVPAAIIPLAIKNYVSTNYPNNFITEISKERRSYDVELNNDLDLDFDKSGNFIRIDK